MNYTFYKLPTETDFAHRYTDAGLRRRAARLREISEGAQTAYVYVNDDRRAYAVRNAARLAELLAPPGPRRPR